MDKEKDKQFEEKIIRDIVFFGSGNLLYVYKKSINIAKALYIVTDIIKDKEPVKWSLRLEANKLVTLNFVGNDLKDNVSYLFSLITSIKGLVSLGTFSKNISQMNSQVLLSECDIILTNLSNIKTSNEDFVLSSDFFKEEKEVGGSSFSETLINEKVNEKKQIFINKTGVDYKGHQKDIIQNMSFKKINPVKTGLERNQRSDDIVYIIKTKGEVTIKDISNSIKGYSEKTIQRELISLLDKKIIKREGERRWSKYSLI